MNQKLYATSEQEVNKMIVDMASWAIFLYRNSQIKADITAFMIIDKPVLFDSQLIYWIIYPN